MESKIKQFNERFPEMGWTTGNCYYYAVMFKARFGGQIYYDVIAGHFVVKVKDKYYDYNGEYVPDKQDAIIQWSKFNKYDSLQRKRIKSGCIL